MQDITPEDEVDVSDLAAIVSALRQGPLGHGLPLVAAARPFTQHAVGGPLWQAHRSATARQSVALRNSRSSFTATTASKHPAEQRHAQRAAHRRTPRRLQRSTR